MDTEKQDKAKRENYIIPELWDIAEEYPGRNRKILLGNTNAKDFIMDYYSFVNANSFKLDSIIKTMIEACKTFEISKECTLVNNAFTKLKELQICSTFEVSPWADIALYWALQSMYDNTSKLVNVIRKKYDDSHMSLRLPDIITTITGKTEFLFTFPKVRVDGIGIAWRNKIPRNSDAIKVYTRMIADYISFCEHIIKSIVLFDEQQHTVFKTYELFGTPIISISEISEIVKSSRGIHSY